MNRYEIAGGAASVAGSTWAFTKAYEHYNQYHYLKDVALPFYKANPVLTNNVESHNQIATRIKDELIPKENADFWDDMYIGTAIVVLTLAYALLRPKNP